MSAASNQSGARNGIASPLKSVRVEPGDKARLDRRDAGHDLDTDKSGAEREHAALIERLSELVQELWADNRFGVLVVLQGMDTSGKDGVIRHLLTGVNPRGCKVVSFGVPTSYELDHDFLWRVHQQIPARGQLGVFNRSHYEDVLVVRVHGLIDDTTASTRFRQINDFERHLSENGWVILKFMLHISKNEQRERLQARLDDPTKNWKMNLNDLKERERWDEYARAYEDALSACSTPHAPWHVIPSDKKWVRDWAIARIVVDRLETLGLRYPRATFDASKVKVR